MHIQTPFRDQKWHGVPTSLQSQLSRAAALSPLMLAAAVAPTPRCSMQQHISRLSFTMALWLMEYPHLLFGIIYGFYLYMCIYVCIYIYTDRYLSISININISISLYLSIYLYIYILYLDWRCIPLSKGLYPTYTSNFPIYIWVEMDVIWLVN